MIKTDGIPVVFREFVGYDDPCKYNAVFFNKAHNILKVQLADEIKGCRVDVNKQFNQHGQKVLLLERGVPDKHYICTNRTSGRERRSIKNFQTVYHELKKHYPNTLALRLEGKSLAFQMALFNTVDVVIAQHGAALTNAIWCNDKCKIIEIVPPEIRQAAFKKNNLGHLAFDYLAKALSLRYYRLPQDNRHSDVDIKNLLSLMSGIYSKSRFFNFRSVIKMM